MSKILLIDDEENARVLTAHFLELAGHEVVMAENGIKGLETADAETFDLIITDIIMPEKEGLETIIDFRKKNADLPILAISGGGILASEELLEMALSVGASAALCKPFNGKSLLEAISRAMRHHSREAS
jgi:DNA-binding response OmpR family regulator